MGDAHGRCKEVLLHHRIEASIRVAAIGISRNQRETTVVWNKRTGEPIHHAIVWQDRRTAPICEDLKQKRIDRLCKTNTPGLVIDALWFRYKRLKWLLDHGGWSKRCSSTG